MKICLVIESYPPNVTGGVSVYGHRLAHAFAELGNDVMVITTSPFRGLASFRPEIEMDGKIKVCKLCLINIYDPYKNQNIPNFLKPIYHVINLWNPVQYFMVRDILKQEKPDIIHVHDIYNFSLSLFDAVRSVGLPSILTLHSFGLLCRKVTLLKSDATICECPNKLCAAYYGAIKIILSSKPDIIISPSQFLIDFHITRGFFPKSKKIKIKNGINLDSPHRIPMHVRHGQFDILFVGRLSKHKGPQILIAAVRKIPDQNLRLHIVGDGDYRPELEILAGGDDRIVFYGSIANMELTSFYSMADVTVVPSLCYDNAPLVIQESYRAGTPVIGSRIGGIPEMICNGYNGFLFDPGDVDDLTRILRNLNANANILENMRESAYESLNAYSMEFHAQSLLQIYRQAIVNNEVRYKEKRNFRDLL